MGPTGYSADGLLQSNAFEPATSVDEKLGFFMKKYSSEAKRAIQTALRTQIYFER